MVTRETFYDYASGNPFVDLQSLNDEILMNPHSPSFNADTSQKVINKTKDLIAELFGCNTSEIIFTSGASESNALALQIPFECDKYCHASIKNNLNRVDYSPYKAVSLVDGYFGMIQPIYKASHIDITQGIQEFVDLYKFKELDKCETISFDGSKIGAMQGIGVLLVKDDFKDNIKPFIYGKQQDGKRGGTLNTLAIKSLYNALLNVQKGYLFKECIVTTDLWEEFRKLNISVYESINMVIFDMTKCDFLKQYNSETIMHLIEMNTGIICGIGSACDGKNKNEVYESFFGNDYKVLRFSIDRYYKHTKTMGRVALKKILEELKSIKKSEELGVENNEM